MKSSKSLENKLRLLFLVSVIILSIDINAQKHTFTNVKGEYKNLSTGESVKSDDIDNITIENLGNGLYKLIDSKESTFFKYSHIEDELYVYKSINGLSSVKTGQKLSLFAEGRPGKLGIDIQPSPILLIYSLED